MSLVGVLLVYFVRSKWDALAVPVVWLGAYCFGWYEKEANPDA